MNDVLEVVVARLTDGVVLEVRSQSIPAKRSQDARGALEAFKVQTPERMLPPVEGQIHRLIRPHPGLHSAHAEAAVAALPHAVPRASPRV